MTSFLPSLALLTLGALTLDLDNIDQIKNKILIFLTPLGEEKKDLVDHKNVHYTIFQVGLKVSGTCSCNMELRKCWRKDPLCIWTASTLAIFTAANRKQTALYV